MPQHYVHGLDESHKFIEIEARKGVQKGTTRAVLKCQPHPLQKLVYDEWELRALVECAVELEH